MESTTSHAFKRPFSRTQQPQRPRDRKAVWNDFKADVALHKAYAIRPEELDSLGQVAMLGSFSSKHDLLFMLNVIRRAGGR